MRAAALRVLQDREAAAGDATAELAGGPCVMEVGASSGASDQ